MNIRLKLFGGTMLLSFAAFSLGTGVARAQSAAQAATNETSQSEKTVSAPVRTSAAYLCGNTWFSAAYGANGLYYRVVTTP
jgi:hypothetical protein